jgi:hypothetical protein
MTTFGNAVKLAAIRRRADTVTADTVVTWLFDHSRRDQPEWRIAGMNRGVPSPSW